jgi:hypothetical protein
MTTYRNILIASIILFLIASMAILAIAGGDIPEVFDYKFSGVDLIKIYAGPVTFNHADHVKDHGLTCNACHHTLEPGETTVEEHCRDCHTEPGFVRGKDAHGLDREDLFERYLNALHFQCIECHKQKRIKDRKRKIPVGCTQCHDRSLLQSSK